MSFMLSENGWRKAEKHLCPECWGENNWTPSDEPIFEQDDLQGVVVLTVEEAKEFKSYFDFICNGMSISDSMWGEVHYLRNKIWGALNRSEQTENKDEIK